MKAAMYTPPSVRKKAKASKPDSAIAIHAQDDDGNNHIVGLGNLRVAIVQDGKFWFAQGLDLDYGAQGNTADEAKTNAFIPERARYKAELNPAGPEPITTTGTTLSSLIARLNE